MSQIWMSHVTHMDEACHTYEYILSHIWVSHVTLINTFCHAYESGKNCCLLRIIVNYCQLQKRPMIWIWVQLLREFRHFEPQHRFFVPKTCTILVCFHPLNAPQNFNLIKWSEMETIYIPSQTTFLQFTHRLTESRSYPDSKQKNKQGLYQSHSMCDYMWHLWRSQNVTNSNLWPCLFLSIFFIFFSKTDLVTFWSQNVTNGQAFKCDWHKPVSVSVF